jgi:hypothetical protein
MATKFDRLAKTALLAAGLGFPWAGPGVTGASFAASRPTKGRTTMQFEIPPPLKEEHAELHAELVRATQAGGKVGDAAKAVAQVLHPHFVKEEEFALPPLGLLPHLAQGSVTPEMRNILPLTDRLKADLPQMLQEHKAIVGALKHLIEAARSERKPEFTHFAEKLMLHAQTEEQVTYPTAILIGEYVKLKLQK